MSGDPVACVTRKVVLLGNHDQDEQISGLVGAEEENYDTGRDCDCVDASDDCVKQGEEEEEDEENVDEDGTRHCSDGGLLASPNKEGENLVGEAKEGACPLFP